MPSLVDRGAPVASRQRGERRRRRGETVRRDAFRPREYGVGHRRDRRKITGRPREGRRAAIPPEGGAFAEARRLRCVVVKALFEGLLRVVSRFNRIRFYGVLIFLFVAHSFRSVSFLFCFYNLPSLLLYLPFLSIVPLVSLPFLYTLFVTEHLAALGSKTYFRAARAEEEQRNLFGAAPVVGGKYRRGNGARDVEDARSRLSPRHRVYSGVAVGRGK